MKPRNKLEREILALAEKLPRIAEKRRQWAFDNCFRNRAVYKPRKREVRCLCCGQTAVWDKNYLEAFIENEQYDCPYCLKTMDLERHSAETKYREHEFFTILTTFRGVQVARTFEVSRGNYGNDHFARYEIDEVFQIWVLDDGKEIITGKPCHRSAFYLSWDLHSPLDIRKHNASCTGCYQMEDVYDIRGNILYPEVRVTSLIKRNGWTKKLIAYQNFFAMTDAMRWLLMEPVAEMLVKTGQFDLFLYMMRRKDRQIPFLHSIRIANRNGYVVQDAQMWLDMLTMAAELGMDTHSPKIVCPEDLIQAHDALLRPVARLREKLQAKKNAASLAEWEAKYREAKSKYFGICFGNEHIEITVIQSVADMAEEGRRMHHCVYSAGYYKRDDSLILTARDREGRRLETIELSLKTMQIVQSRGVNNRTTPYHDAIIKLVKDNITQFRIA